RNRWLMACLPLPERPIPAGAGRRIFFWWDNPGHFGTSFHSTGRRWETGPGGRIFFLVRQTATFLYIVSFHRFPGRIGAGPATPPDSARPPNCKPGNPNIWEAGRPATWKSARELPHGPVTLPMDRSVKARLSAGSCNATLSEHFRRGRLPPFSGQD